MYPDTADVISCTIVEIVSCVMAALAVSWIIAVDVISCIMAVGVSCIMTGLVVASCIMTELALDSCTIGEGSTTAARAV